MSRPISNISKSISKSKQGQTPTKNEFTTTLPAFVKDHPQLFYISLEYDPKTDSVTQLETDQVNGDLPPLFEAEPPFSPQRFTYKVVVTLDKNEVLQMGWYSIPKQLVTTNRGTYHFSITTLNKPQSFIRLYLPSNGLVWTGIIK